MPLITKYLSFCWLLWIATQTAFAQKPKQWVFRVETSPPMAAKEMKKLGIERQYLVKDSLKAVSLANDVLLKIQNAGYLEAKLRNLHWTRDTIFMDLQNIYIYQWKKLQKGNLPKAFFSQLFFREKHFNQKPFNWTQIQALQNKIVAIAENSGYPFASVNLDSININTKNQITATLNYQEGKAFFFDTLQIVGNAKVKPLFLKRYLRLYPDQLFSQKKVTQATKILQQLQFIKIDKPLFIRFEQNLAKPILNISPRKVNQFDGILGLLPNEGRQNNLLLTGELNFKLQNLLGQGISLKTEWQRPQAEAQNLNIAYEHPVLIGSIIDIGFQLQLLRQDSSFLNVERKFDIFYRFSNNDKLVVQFNLRTSRLGKALTSDNILNDTRSNTDFLSTGLGYQWSRLDDFFYPKKGSKASLMLNIGNKNLIQTTAIPDSIFKLLPQTTTQLVLKFDLERYFLIQKQNTFLIKLQAGSIINQNLFINDLFRLGGLNSLRGHNQNNFFASDYFIINAEYRIFTAPDSFFFMFYDQAYLNNRITAINTNDFPLGVGVGLSLAVKAGIFNLAYALGQSKDQAISFNRSKVHFGLVSKF